jgi:thiamine-monophosphate kinase
MPGDRSVSDVGEFGLIERISRIVGPTQAIVGIGDDVAVLNAAGPEYQLATADMLVDGVHFHMGSVDAFELGRRSIAVNLSDVAAAGGLPTFALTSIALPPDTPLAFVERLYTGMKNEASRFGVEIVGGNITGTPGPLCIDIAMLGRVPKSEVVLRSGAEIGDVLVVTGVLGGAAAKRLQSERARLLSGIEPSSHASKLIVPDARVHAGRTFAESHFAHAMIDISDGLAGDLGHLARSSGVGAVIREESIPISIGARQAAPELGVTPLDLALFGGEDYELLVAMPEASLEPCRRALGPIPAYEVGTVLAEDQGILLELTGGKRTMLRQGAWEHF